MNEQPDKNDALTTRLYCALMAIVQDDEHRAYLKANDLKVFDQCIMALCDYVDGYKYDRKSPQDL